MMRVVCDFAAMSVCELQKGYEPDEFSITGEDGKVWVFWLSVKWRKGVLR